LVTRGQFKKLRLIHAIAKKKPSKQVGGSGGTGSDPDAITVAPPDDAEVASADAEIASQLASPKSDFVPSSATPMELEDGQALRTHQSSQVF
jgi:hypothetical protein